MFISMGFKLCLVAALVVACVGDARQPAKPRTETQALTAKSGKYEAVLRLRNYNSTYDAGTWYGADIEKPKKVVALLEVRFAGTRVGIGRGAYSDLSDPDTMKFTVSGRNYILHVEGGDAGASYTARLTFSGRDLISRRVEDNSFPKNFYEETRYVNIPIKE